MKYGKTQSVSLTRLVMTLFLFLFWLSGTVFAAEYPQDIRPVPEGDLTGKVVILHTNDVHGAIAGYAKLATLRDTLEKRGAEVILADAGDFSQGEVEVNMSKGLDAINLMNAAGYTLATLGNHEFDFGYETLRENLKEAEFPVLCANVYENGSPILAPGYVYPAKSGLKIGFLGLETEESKTKAKPTLSVGLTFYGGDDMDRLASEEAEDLRKEDADVVIALTHLGVNVESAEGKNRSLDLWKNSTGIDFLIDGHSHTVMTAGPAGEPIQSTGTKFQYIGVLVIGPDGKIEDHYLVETEPLPADESSPVFAAAQKIEDRVNAEYEVKIAESEVEFTGEKEANRKGETNNGDLSTDAMLWQILKDPDALQVPADHVLAILNGGGLRAGIEPGDVTKKDIKDVHPFSNTLVVLYVKGEDILEVLEASTFCTPEPIGGYPQTAGIQFSVDTTKPYDKGKLYPGSTYYGPKSIRRVTIKNINGKPFSSEDTYAVAVNDFQALGGDTYFAFAGKDGFDTGIMIDEVLISYIQEELGGRLTKEKYGATRGDAEIITADSKTAEAEKTAAADAGKENAAAAEEIKENAPAADAGKEEKTAAAEAAPGSEYEVRKGDCLFTIAEQAYGDGKKWRLIYENNRKIIRDPGVIRPGQILKLPEAS